MEQNLHVPRNGIKDDFRNLPYSAACGGVWEIYFSCAPGRGIIHKEIKRVIRKFAWMYYSCSSKDMTLIPNRRKYNLILIIGKFKILMYHEIF